MHADYYTHSSAEAFFRSIAHLTSCGAEIELERINVHLQVCFQYMRKSETRRTMQRSIRYAAKIQLQRTNLLSHLSNSNAVRSAYHREFVLNDFVKPRVAMLLST